MIDADALAKELMHEGLGYQYNRVMCAPTVDAEPVRHGYWIRWRDLNGIKRCKCSECIVSYGNMDTPYCPNCGAKMDGEDDDETD